MIQHNANFLRRCQGCGHRKDVAWHFCFGEPNPIALDRVLAKRFPFTAFQLATVRIKYELSGLQLHVLACTAVQMAQDVEEVAGFTLDLPQHGPPTLISVMERTSHTMRRLAHALSTVADNDQTKGDRNE
jgi:hypothetical protein